MQELRVCGIFAKNYSHEEVQYDFKVSSQWMLLVTKAYPGETASSHTNQLNNHNSAWWPLDEVDSLN